MASDLKQVWQSATAFTITCSALANAAGRQSTMVSNASPSYPRAKITVDLIVGTTPTAGTTLDFYLLRSNGTVRSDNAGASDAAITINNAQPIGSMIVPAATSDTHYYADFMVDDLGTSWGIAVVNRSGVALKTDAGNNNSITYEYAHTQAS